jgi:C_GCAxxG_C_C family probable redox protein
MIKRAFIYLSEETWTTYAEKAYQLGDQYERIYHGCGQCLVAAVFDALGFQQDAVFSAATGLAGGLGLVGDSTCAAMVGAIMIFGLFYPRRREFFDDDRENKYQTYLLAQKLIDRYQSQYGSTRCHDIHSKILGRPYDLSVPDERKAFEEAGAHVDKCTEVVALAAKWTVEILSQAVLNEQ